MQKGSMIERFRKTKQELVDHKDGIRTAFQMAWPSVLESFFIALAGMVDSLMVSALGAYAVAAVGLTTQPKFIGLCFFMALNVAVSALVARRKGEERREDANRIFVVAILIVAILGTVISILCVSFAEPIMKLAGAEADTIKASADYFKIIMGGMMFNIVTMTINAAQRGSGNTRITMKTNITANAVNMIGNYLLIEGRLGFPAWGIKGAAIATVFGTVVACGMAIRSVCTRNTFVSIIYIWREKIRPRFSSLKSIFSISSTVFAEQLLMRVGFLAVALMAADMGTKGFAAHQVAMNVMSLSFSFGDGFQVAAVSLIGQSLGRKDPDQAKFYGSVCRYMGLIVSLILSLLYLLCGKMYFNLYFQEADIVEIGVRIMQLMPLIVILQVSQIIYMGCLRGAGDVRFTMVASTFSVTLVRTLVSYLFCYTFGMGIVGIWIGMIGDQLTRYILTSTRFRAGKWTAIKI